MLSRLKYNIFCICVVIGSITVGCVNLPNPQDMNTVSQSTNPDSMISSLQETLAYELNKTSIEQTLPQNIDPTQVVSLLETENQNIQATLDAFQAQMNQSILSKNNLDNITNTQSTVTTEPLNASADQANTSSLAELQQIIDDLAAQIATNNQIITVYENLPSSASQINPAPATIIMPTSTTASIATNTTVPIPTNAVAASNNLFSSDDISQLLLNMNDFSSGWQVSYNTCGLKANLTEFMTVKKIDVNLELHFSEENALAAYNSEKSEATESANKRGLAGYGVKDLSTSPFEMFSWVSTPSANNINFGDERWEIYGVYKNVVMHLKNHGSLWAANENYAASMANTQMYKLVENSHLAGSEIPYAGCATTLSTAPTGPIPTPTVTSGSVSDVFVYVNPTQGPTSTPIPSPTIVPTSTPAFIYIHPTPTPLYTATPFPTYTPAPTQIPTPTPIPIPTSKILYYAYDLCTSNSWCTGTKKERSLVSINPDGSDKTKIFFNSNDKYYENLDVTNTGNRFVYENSGFMTAINMDGSDQINLGDNYTKHPSWNPSGTKIAFQSTNSIPSSPSNGRNRIWTMDNDGNNQMIYGEGQGPVWSNNSNNIAYICPLQTWAEPRSTICILNTDNSSVTKFEGLLDKIDYLKPTFIEGYGAGLPPTIFHEDRSNNETTDSFYVSGISDISWGPNDDFIIFHMGGAIVSPPPHYISQHVPNAFFKLNINTNELTKIYSLQFPQPPNNDPAHEDVPILAGVSQPHISPDGTKISFVKNWKMDHYGFMDNVGVTWKSITTHDIYTVNIDGSNVQNITNNVNQLINSFVIEPNSDHPTEDQFTINRNRFGPYLSAPVWVTIWE